MRIVHFGKFGEGTSGNARMVSFRRALEQLESRVVLALRLQGEGEVFPIGIEGRVGVVLIDRKGAPQRRFGVRRS